MESTKINPLFTNKYTVHTYIYHIICVHYKKVLHERKRHTAHLSCSCAMGGGYPYAGQGVPLFIFLFLLEGYPLSKGPGTRYWGTPTPQWADRHL